MKWMCGKVNHRDERLRIFLLLAMIYIAHSSRLKISRTNPNAIYMPFCVQCFRITLLLAKFFLIEVFLCPFLMKASFS